MTHKKYDIVRFVVGPVLRPVKVVLVLVRVHVMIDNRYSVLCMSCGYAQVWSLGC